MAPPEIRTKSASAVGPTANVWTQENRVSSDGQFREIPVPDLLPIAVEFLGRFAAVEGQSKIQGIFKWPPFASAQTQVTQDPFDQGELYFALTDVAQTLNALGFDVERILGGKHGGKPHPIAASANKVEDLNAWYSPSDDALTFGRGAEKWHLASDSDVSVHEAGHLFLDHLHPGFGGYFGNEGGAIHEGFGDALAALRTDDPEMSEDFATALGRAPSKTDGLRRVNNDLALTDVSEEVHDRGQVYAGFFWSVKNRLGLPSRQAADLALKLLINHAANYRTSRPKPGDFVDAVLKGAKALNDSGNLGMPYEKIREIVLEEGRRRKILPPPLGGGDRVYVNMSEALRDFGTASVFEKNSEVPYLGGVQERYAQYYLSPTLGKIPVLSRGIFVHRKPAAMVPEISVQDARKFNAGEVDETIRVSMDEARQKVMTNLLYKMWVIRLERLRLPGYPTKAAELTRFQQVESQYRLLEEAKAAWDKNPQPTFVIYPGGTNLVYAFNLGAAHFYVDALTGNVDMHREVFY